MREGRITRVATYTYSSAPNMNHFTALSNYLVLFSSFVSIVTVLTSHASPKRC
jgi:hypothetical protein